MKHLRPLLLTILFVLSSASFGKAFKTEFIRFELPANWSCKQEELDWVCQPDNLSERSEAIIGVVVKAINEVDDTFPKYEEMLNTPRQMRDLLGNAYTSKVNYVKQRQIKGQPWVDALLLGSEIPGFYTRNVVSIKDKVAGLISYSVAESVYPKYAAMMDTMLDSLEIFFDPKAYNDLMKQGPYSLLGRGAKHTIRGAAVEMNDKPKSKIPGGDSSLMVGAALLVGLALYIVWKRKQQSR